MHKLLIVCTITSFVFFLSSLFFLYFTHVHSHACAPKPQINFFIQTRHYNITLLDYNISQYASVYSINFTYFDTQYDGSKNGHRPTKFCSHINTPTLSNRSNLYLQPYTINIFQQFGPTYFGFRIFPFFFSLIFFLLIISFAPHVHFQSFLLIIIIIFLFLSLSPLASITPRPSHISCFDTII